MTSLATIHIAKKQLGLDDEVFRALCARVTGKTSTRAMNDNERQRLIAEFHRQGFEQAFKGSRKPLEGRFAKTLQAFWISAWQLGIIQNRSDEALVAFVKRQTGAHHVRFVHHASEARKVIEALKSIMTREAGVDWNDRAAENGRVVAEAQYRILRRHNQAPCETLNEWMAANPHHRGWPAIHRALGRHVRRVQK